MMANSTSTEDLSSKSHISFVFTLLLFSTGCFGNLATLILFCKKKLNILNLFFIVVAISDFLTLLAALFGRYMDFFTGLGNLADRNLTVCKLTTFFGNTANLTSIWTIVAMTSQRAASVVWPYRFKSLYTTRNAGAYIICVVVIAAGVHATPNLIDRSLQELNGTTICRPDPSPEIRPNIIAWIQLFLFTILPFFIIIISNIVLIRKVKYLFVCLFFFSDCEQMCF